LTNGLLRFPVVDLLYNGFNHWSVGKFNTWFHEWNRCGNETTLPWGILKNGIKPDLMLPVLLWYLPHGLIGILIVGILSAAMSSECYNPFIGSGNGRGSLTEAR
jgi:hypothetical protein